MASKSTTITVEFDAIQTALEVLEPLDETQRKFAVTMILTRLGLGSMTAFANPVESGGGDVISTPSALGKNVNVKEFLKAKSPATDLERYVCLAYYLTHNNNVQSFATRDIIKLNTEAFANDFSNAAATAMNATRQSKLLSRAGGGKKRITTRGEALVDALPDRTKVREATRLSAPRKRKKRSSNK